MNERVKTLVLVFVNNYLHRKRRVFAKTAEIMVKTRVSGIASLSTIKPMSAYRLYAMDDYNKKKSKVKVTPITNKNSMCVHKYNGIHAVAIDKSKNYSIIELCRKLSLMESL
jgi:hypothetical protein